MQDFLEVLGKNREKEERDIFQKIEGIARSISESHSLYFRDCLVFYLRTITDILKGTSDVSMIEGLNAIEKLIKVSVEDFNLLYDDLFSALLYIIHGKKDVISYVEVNFEDDHFNSKWDEILYQINKINNDNIDTYREYRFWRLWHASNKTKEYRWYKGIWESTDRGYKDIIVTQLEKYAREQGSLF